MNKELEMIREDYLLNVMSLVLNKEEYERACNYLRSIPEEELVQFISELKEKSKSYQNSTQKERLKTLQQIYDHRFKNKYEPAILYQETKLYTEEDKKNIFSIISSSHVKDYVYLTTKEDRFLIDLWEGKQNWDIDVENGESRGMIRIPSDLFFAKTIPLTDCIIEIDESKDLPNGQIVKARIICFPNYSELIDKSNAEQSEEYFDIGIFIFYKDDIPCWFLVFGLCRGIDSLIYKTRFGLFPNVKLDNPNQTYVMSSLATSFLETWYGLQIALLHPDVKNVFKNPQRVSESNVKDNTSTRKNKKRFVRYVRKHFVTLQELEEHAHTEEAEKKYKRKCLVWYVIGHWRTYKNGTKVFIQPYWKGALRTIKKSDDVEKRNRSVIYENGNLIGR